jgi:hypothetical protein
VEVLVADGILGLVTLVLVVLLAEELDHQVPNQLVNLLSQQLLVLRK